MAANTTISTRRSSADRVREIARQYGMKHQFVIDALLSAWDMLSDEQRAIAITRETRRMDNAASSIRDTTQVSRSKRRGNVSMNGHSSHPATAIHSTASPGQTNQQNGSKIESQEKS